MNTLNAVDAPALSKTKPAPLQQLLDTAKSMRPSIYKVAAGFELFEDGDAFMRYTASEPGFEFRGDTQEELIAEIAAAARMVA